jgi:hypothetical protein
MLPTAREGATADRCPFPILCARVGCSRDGVQSMLCCSPVTSGSWALRRGDEGETACAPQPSCAGGCRARRRHGAAVRTLRATAVARAWRRSTWAPHAAGAPVQRYA